MIHLSLNNEPVQVEADTLLSEALNAWGYGDAKIAVAINGEFVPRTQYTIQPLHDGDQLDVVKPVGGG
ncbi:sulfur carrier protein ThiS [Marinimicrobium sp. ABcell2]|uniref:sulfur carrier protein ThiS n=1 Tax=Marinimicrobium sp. ABcell2 TaxID=3069751 RepID=UPI0027B03CFF|nr:sulfur carrier protein ThiS [Marinimicrobium sp. ABcell2]MDQ2077274.1 sulfur carrier protein ThiS [Marinimicrobium sp. ABcell2]